jgi:hypothetical protein
METLIKAIQSASIPTLLIVAGLFILVLAFVTKIGGIIEVSPERKRWNIPIGLLLLTIGLILHFATIPPPTTSPVTPPTALPTTPPLRNFKELEQALAAVNINFSEPKLRAQLDNPFSKYPQFAKGCLKLLSNKRLREKVYFDVIFWYYTEELRGSVNFDSPDGDLNMNTLKVAMVSAYNTRTGSNALSFGDIVELK